MIKAVFFDLNETLLNMNLQLKNSGIISLIDNYYSVDMVKNINHLI
ncbi:MAG: hypothetical protein WCR79_05315 [Fusobacterium sp.]